MEEPAFSVPDEGSTTGGAAPLASGPATSLSPNVSDPQGDIVEISTAHPSPYYKEGSTYWVRCTATAQPYIGSSFDPCGNVYLYDATRKSSTEVPDINEQEDAEYDACGTKVSSGGTHSWHVVGTEYMSSGWVGGHVTTIPTSEPTSCLGTWKLVYSFTETFSDGEKLTDTIEVPFTVTAVPIPASATWGGGNPSELACSQICSGDPVNTATGDYAERSADLAIPGRGPGLAMTRTYSSLAAHAGVSSVLGRGWAFSYGMSLKVDPEKGFVTITNQNGSQTQFDAAPGGGYVAPPRILATLVHNEDGTYTYKVKARTIYTFNSSGKLTGVADLNGDKTTLAYNEAGQLHTATDGAGRTLTFTYNEAGQLIKVADSTGRSVSYAYNAAGRLAEVTDVRGKITKFTYDESGLLLTREDPRKDVVMTNTYDSGGRVLTQTDALKNKTTYSYEEAGTTTTTKVTDPRGYVTEYEYKGGVLAKKIEGAGTASSATWTYEHDPDTEGITALTDPNGHTSHATYDSRGNQTSTEDALIHKTKSVYDSLDDLTEYTDANGVTTTYKYDEKGNLLSSSTPLVGSEPLQTRTVSYAHESKEHPGDVTAITDPNGKKTTLAYDPAGDLASVTDPEGDETTYTYDEIGERLTQVSPRGNVSGGKATEYTTTFTYDAAGNRLTAVDPLGHERKWTYDADGNLETETDPNLHKTTFTYNAANQQTKVEKPNGNTTETAYDADGNVASQTDGLKHATTYAYDPLDHLASSIDPLGREGTYAYDALGNLKTRKDPEGRVTTYSYDDANRLTKVSYSDGMTPTTEYGYDADGRRTSMKDGTGESTFKYDSLGRLTEAKDGHGDTTSYGYDLAGNETSITYPNGKKVTRSFDNASRLASVADWLGNTTSFAYDPNSNLLSSSFPKGTSNTDEYAYNHADQMSAVTMKEGTETLASLGYTRDKVGQLESLTSKGLPGAESEAFGYDANNRLTKAGTESFEYDAASNLTKAPGTTNTYDNASELEAGTTASYTYDKEGERTRTAPSATEPPVFNLALGGVGSGQGQLSSPAGVATDKEGDAWVSDTGHNRIQEFNSKGEFIRQFGASGEGKGQFREPRGLAISQSSGNLYVADRSNNRIQEFNSKGEFIRAWGWGVLNGAAELQVCTTACRAGISGTGNGQFSGLQGLAVDPEGHLWSVEAGKASARVQKFSSEGAYLSQFGALGTEAGKFESPQGIAVSSAGNVYVADTTNNRIQEFKPSGELIRGFGWGVANGEAKLQTCTTTCQVGIAGAGNGQLSHPSGLAFDPEGKLWVADAQNNRAQRFSAEGEYLSQFGAAGNNNGQLSEPQGISVDSSGDVWVADTQNNRVEEWFWQITTYGYDQAGNLTSVQRREFGKTPAINETYAYDGASLRASQTVAGTKSFLTWDGTGGLPLLLNDGSANYIYGAGGLPIEQIASETPTYYHHDQLGSTRMLTNSSGASTGKFTYGAYGMLTGSSGTQTTPLGFAGQFTSAQSGLQYLRARVYDPATGQFLTRDPMEALTMAPYGYASDNPLRYVDPSGQCGIGSASEALESVNPFSEENCAYQAAKAAVELFGGNAGLLAGVTMTAAAILAPTPFAPLAAALSAVSAAASAYAAGQDAANGNTLQAAIDGLASVLGGTAAAERLLTELESISPSLAGESSAQQSQALADLLDRLGYRAEAASILNSLCNP